jgi:hypothetical protein
VHVGGRVVSPAQKLPLPPRKLIWYMVVNVLEGRFGSIITGHLNLETVCSEG